MSKNLGCGCNCNGNGNGTQNAIRVDKPVQQGDSFNLTVQYKEDGTATALPQGYDMIVGFYDSMGRMVKHSSLWDGTIVYNQNNTYTLSVTHEESMMMMGDISLEFTIRDLHNVDHASDIIVIPFEPRKNNSLI